MVRKFLINISAIVFMLFLMVLFICSLITPNALYLDILDHYTTVVGVYSIIIISMCTVYTLIELILLVLSFFLDILIERLESIN